VVLLFMFSLCILTTDLVVTAMDAVFSLMTMKNDKKWIQRKTISKKNIKYVTKSVLLAMPFYINSQTMKCKIVPLGATTTLKAYFWKRTKKKERKTSHNIFRTVVTFVLLITSQGKALAEFTHVIYLSSFSLCTYNT